MLAERAVAGVTRRSRPALAALVVALLACGSARAAPDPCDEDEVLVIPEGAGPRIVALLQDVSGEAPLEGGYRFGDISIDVSRIVFTLVEEGREAPVGRIVAEPEGEASGADARSGSFALRVETESDDPLVRRHLEAGVDSIVAHDEGDIYATVTPAGCSDRPAAAPEDPAWRRPLPEAPPPWEAPLPWLPAVPLALVMLAWIRGRGRSASREPAAPPVDRASVSPWQLPGYVLLLFMLCANVAGRAGLGDWFWGGVLLTGAVTALVLARGWVRVERGASLSAALPSLLAASVAVTAVGWFLFHGLHYDTMCHHGYTRLVLRHGAPPEAPGDPSALSSYHFAFDVLAAATQRVVGARGLEWSLDVTSLLCLWVVALAALGLVRRWRVPPWVQAMAVLLLVLGSGPLFLRDVFDALVPDRAIQPEYLEYWHGGTYMSLAELAGRRAAVLGALVLVLLLDRLRVGALSPEALGRPGRAWGEAGLLALLLAAAALSSEQLLLHGLVGVVAALAVRRFEGWRGLWRHALAGLVGLTLVAFLGGFVVALLRHVLGLEVTDPTHAGAAVSLRPPGLPTFLLERATIVPVASVDWLRLMLLEFGPVLPLVAGLAARRSGTPRSYAAAVLAIVVVGLLAAHVLASAAFGYRVDMHRLAIGPQQLALLHAPLVVWTLVRGRVAAGALVLVVAAVSVVGPVGYVLGEASLEAALVGPALVALVALSALALATPRPAGVVVRRLPALLLIPLLLVAAASSHHGLKTSAQWERFPTTLRDALREDEGRAVLTDALAGNLLLAHGYRVVAPHMRGDLTALDPEQHGAFLASFDEEAWRVRRPTLFVGDEASLEAVRSALSGSGVRLEVRQVLERGGDYVELWRTPEVAPEPASDRLVIARFHPPGS